MHTCSSAYLAARARARAACKQVRAYGDIGSRGVIIATISHDWSYINYRGQTRSGERISLSLGWCHIDAAMPPLLRGIAEVTPRRVGTWGLCIYAAARWRFWGCRAFWSAMKSCLLELMACCLQMQPCMCGDTLNLRDWASLERSSGGESKSRLALYISYATTGYVEFRI